MAIHDQNHPEKKAGEVFLTNVFPANYDDIGWKTKRAGTVAFDKYGKPHSDDTGYIPVFVQRSELEASEWDIEIVDAPYEEVTK